jgi:ATP-dependent Lon protease
MFIATANTLETVPRPLIDRMEIIELKAYTRTEKMMIAKNHLIPKQLKRHGLTKRTCKITDEAIAEVIEYYTREAGVRGLEKQIASLCRKVAKRIVSGESAWETIDLKNLKDYLGSRKLLPQQINESDEIGLVNGLAYTEVGGDMLEIETAILDGTGKIELTGSLGDVMKESAHAAVSYIRSRAKELGIPSDFYKTKDIHIHVPEGATPKDGPSAGITMMTALVSALTGTKVRRDVAMTGEITLRGRVLAIGGLKEKTMAAYLAGVRQVIIPADNIRDLEDIDPEARENLLFIPCKTADEVLRHALVREETASSSFMNIKEDISVNNTDISDNLTERPEVRALKTI